jgi:hypothetical protein
VYVIDVTFDATSHVRTEPSAPVVAHTLVVAAAVLLLIVVVVALIVAVLIVGHTAIAVMAPLWKQASGYGTVKKKIPKKK